MPDFKPKPGSFLPFLEYSQREKLAAPASLLDILARQIQPCLPIGDLQTLSGMEASRYREALKSLRDAGYIAIEGEALDGTVRLLARPA
jgi:DNA-binding IclR family transcriptional regulator